MKDYLKKRIALPINAALGLALLVFVVQMQPEMPHSSTERPSVPVSYIAVQEYQLKPEIIGYGTVEPDLDLQAKSEVTGRITYIHPSLKKGEIFNKDTLLLQIDDRDYQLQLKQAEADLLANEANLKEMELNIENNELELKLSLKKQKVQEKEFARLKKLRKGGTISQSRLETEEQKLLQQKQEVQQLRNKQTTLPSQLEVIKAQRERSRAQLEKSQRDLERTKIRIPFDGRISKVYTELDQFVATGAQLFDAVGLEKVLINAQFPVEQFSLFAKNFGLGKMNMETPGEVPSMAKVLDSLGLSAEVELAGGNFKSWTGIVERFSDNLDSQSRTVGVIIGVQNTYRNLQPGIRPPLLQGMYMKIILKGAPRKAFAIPRFALHEGEIYTVSANDKLQRVKLPDSQRQGNIVLVNSGLAEGDKVITSDVFPAVNGMAVTPVEDKEVVSQMKAWLGAGQ